MMKKTTKVASFLLAGVLATFCFVGGTFAKYTTSASGEDEARVAYWGFQNDVDLDMDLFDGEYTNVDSQDDANVVAPGTEKEETFTFKYVDNANGGTAITAPEVAYNFEVDFTATGSYDDLDANTNFVWTLKMPGAAAATEYQTVAALEAAIESLNKTGDEFYAAGELPANFADGDNTITLGWKWKFETANSVAAEQDATDTAMGNAAALDNVKFAIAISATQID